MYPKGDDVFAIDYIRIVPDRFVQGRPRILSGAAANLGSNESLSQHLKDEETRVQALRAQRQALEQAPALAKLLPHPSILKRYLEPFLDTLNHDPSRGGAPRQAHRHDRAPAHWGGR